MLDLRTVLATVSLLLAPLVQDDAERLAAFGKYFQIRELGKAGEVTPHWLPDGNRFWFAEGAPAETIIWVIDPEADTKEPLVETKGFREKLTKVLGHEPPYQGLPFAEIATPKEGVFDFEVEERRFRYTFDGEKLTPLPAKDPDQAKRDEPRFVRKGFAAGSPDTMEARSPDGHWFARDEDTDLWLRSSRDDQSVRLTEDGTVDTPWRVDDARWSPDGLVLAAARADLRGVARVPIVHWLENIETVEFAPYVKAGGRMPRSALYFFDVVSGERVLVEATDRPDQYVFRIGWSADGRELLFMTMDRIFQNLELRAANRVTGRSRTVLTESSQTFIGALHFNTTWQGRYTPVGDDGRFVWLSERDGWFRPYLYDRQGKLLATLTQGEFDVLRIDQVDAERGWVYFTAHGEPHPYDTHLYRVRLDGRDHRRLTEGFGEHQASFSPSKRFFVDSHSTAARPPRTELRRVEGTLIRTLAEVDPKTLTDAGFVPPEPFQVLAADGKTELHGLLYKPKDFDPNGKLPVLDYIYNGPFTTWVPRTFGDGRGWMAGATAQAGFAVLIVDGRGTPERGKAFQDVVYRSFGQNEIPDHAAALRQLAERDTVLDTSRVGIFGGSWGGYMTIRALVTHPEVYHVGVATNSVADLHDHAASPIEGYMGLPQEHPEDYRRASSLLLADQLKGKLLLIHGTSDVNATFSATMKMVAALIEAGKPHDLIVLPESNHWPRGKNQQYASVAQLRYFLEHLKSRTPAPATGGD